MAASSRDKFVVANPAAAHSTIIIGAAVSPPKAVGGAAATATAAAAAAAAAATVAAAAVSGAAAAAAPVLAFKADPVAANAAEEPWPSGLFLELRAAASRHGCLAVLWVAWRYASLNILVENLEERSQYGEISSLLGIFNLVALIEALLLGVGIVPFSDMARIVVEFGDTPLTRFNNVMAMCIMGFSFFNLCVIVMLSFYITAVHKARRHLELRNFPLFGIPLLLVVGSVFAALLWCIANCFVQLPGGYGWFALTLIAVCVAIGVPVILFAFFFRLAEKRTDPGDHHNVRHGLAPAPAEPSSKLTDLTKADLDAILREALMRLSAK
jgi:hypothetical protein